MDVNTHACGGLPAASLVTGHACNDDNNNHLSNCNDTSCACGGNDDDDVSTADIDGSIRGGIGTAGTCDHIVHISDEKIQGLKNNNARKIFAVDIDGTITENGNGRIHLGALGALRRLTEDGHSVIFVSGRSSIEGYLLSVFGGVTHMAVGENGGCITTGPDTHTLIGDKAQCQRAFDAICQEIPDAKKKNVFPRMTEVVMERTFDLDAARQVVKRRGLDVVLSDSQFGYHINSPGVDKGSGFALVAKNMSVKKSDVIAIGDSATDIPLFRMADTSIALGNAFDDVKAAATMTVKSEAGDGVLEALDILAPTLFSHVTTRR